MASARPRRVLIPYMCDHAYGLAAALRHHGVDASVLPRTDRRSLERALRHVIGNECLPCIATTGDMLRALDGQGRSDSPPAFVMPTAPGPCKFGQYHRLHRCILDREGWNDVALLSPSSAEAYAELGTELGPGLERLTWRAVVAIDELLALRREHRPYEETPGAADGLYQEMLERVVASVERGGEDLEPTLAAAARWFASLPLKQPRQERPVVVIVGEIYVRLHPFCNMEIDRVIERLGGEALVVPLREWFLYANHRRREDARWERDPGKWLRATLQGGVMRRDARRLRSVVAAARRHRVEPSVRRLLRAARPFVTPYLGGEAALSVGWATVAREAGFAGVLHISPFHCMPGAILQGVSRAVRERVGLPWLDLWFDAQDETHLLTRTEAFMHQVRDYFSRSQKQRVLMS